MLLCCGYCPADKAAQEGAAYAEQLRERLEKQLYRRARGLGYELEKIEPPLQEITRQTADLIGQFRRTRDGAEPLYGFKSQEGAPRTGAGIDPVFP